MTAIYLIMGYFCISSNFCRDLYPLLELYKIDFSLSAHISLPGHLTADSVGN